MKETILTINKKLFCFKLENIFSSKAIDLIYDLMRDFQSKFTDTDLYGDDVFEYAANEFVELDTMEDGVYFISDTKDTSIDITEQKLQELVEAKDGFVGWTAPDKSKFVIGKSFWKLNQNIGGFDEDDEVIKSRIRIGDRDYIVEASDGVVTHRIVSSEEDWDVPLCVIEGFEKADVKSMAVAFAESVKKAETHKKAAVVRFAGADMDYMMEVDGLGRATIRNVQKILSEDLEEVGVVFLNDSKEIEKHIYKSNLESAMSMGTYGNSQEF